jgi:hypothetical protein
MEKIMTEMNGELLEIRDLMPTEIAEISGAMNSVGPLISAGAAVLRFLNDINFQFYGCFTEGGTQTCVYSHDLP